METSPPAATRPRRNGRAAALFGLLFYHAFTLAATLTGAWVNYGPGRDPSVGQPYWHRWFAEWFAAVALGPFNLLRYNEHVPIGYGVAGPLILGLLLAGALVTVPRMRWWPLVLTLEAMLMIVWCFCGWFHQLMGI